MFGEVLKPFGQTQGIQSLAEIIKKKKLVYIWDNDTFTAFDTFYLNTLFSCINLKIIHTLHNFRSK
jgi:hypothetical protein